MHTCCVARHSNNSKVCATSVFCFIAVVFFLDKTWITLYNHTAGVDTCRVRCEPVADSAIGLLTAETRVDESLLDRGKQEVYHAVRQPLGTAVVGAEGLPKHG